MVLVDEINRAPARVQSALLEAMAERQVTVGGRTFAMPKPFLVVATQNPVESEGVYPLAEAQRDRFLMRIPVDYPTPSEERAIVARMADEPPQAARLLDPADVVDLQLAARRVAIDEAAVDYAIRLVLATRDPAAHGLQKLVGLLEYGASPRASLGLVRSARAMALLRGRERAVPQDVYDVAYDILNARLALSYRALAEGFTIDDVLVELLTTVPAPGSHSVATLPVAAAAPTTPDAGHGVMRRRTDRAPHADAADRPAGRSTGREVTSARRVGLDLPARLRRIELAVGHKVLGRRDGHHASLVLGHGVEPGEARPYEPGDDVRRMDWSILARTGEPHVRDAIQERDLDVAVLVDRSGSLDFGTVGWRKADLARQRRIGRVRARRPRRRPDRSGRRDRRWATDRADPRRSPASAGPRGQRGTVTTRRTGRSRSRHRRSSDVSCRAVGSRSWSRTSSPRTETWSPALARLGRRSEVIAVEVVDPRELRLPDVGLLVVEDPETGRQRTIDTSDERFRVRLAEVADRRRAARSSAIRRAGRHPPATPDGHGVDRSARGLPLPTPSRPSAGSAGGVPSHGGAAR